MRQETINIYKYDELSAEAQETVREWVNEEGQELTIYGDEIVHSFITFFEQFDGVDLVNWSINYSLCQRPLFKFKYDRNEIEDLSGARAFAYFENNFLWKQRVTKADIKTVPFLSINDHKKVKDCPLTGLYYDDGYIEAFQDALKEGYSIDKAINEVIEKLIFYLRDYSELVESEEYIHNLCMDNAWEFYHDGKLHA